MNKIFNFSKTNFYIFLIILVSIILKFFYFLNLDSWFDEWNMIYTVDPNISNNLTWERFFGDRGDGFLPEYYPPLNAFSLKYFLKFTGYFTENARFYSLIFGILSFIPFYLLAHKISGKKCANISSVIFVLNLFIIWQSNEIRPHSFVLFFSLLSLIFFIEIIENKKNLLFYSVYVIISVLLLSSWPFALTIYFGKTIYILINYKLKNLKLLSLFILYFLILILYVLINHEYLIYHLKRDEHYTNLEISFFYSFHFRSFFGSIPMGGIMLILFGIFLIKDIKKNFYSSTNLNILFYIIISTYILIISYSIFRAGVISPKYVIFILPLIIIWISDKILLIKFHKELIVLIILANIVNTYFYFFENPIDRPPIREVIHRISQNDTSVLVMNETQVFINAFSNYKSFKGKNLKIINIRKNKIDVNLFWFVCLNNPRFAVGNKILPIEKKCKIIDNDQNFKEVDELKIKDFYVKKYLKVNS